MMIYELERPDIDCIIDCCEKLEAEEKIKSSLFWRKSQSYIIHPQRCGLLQSNR